MILSQSVMAATSELSLWAIGRRRRLRVSGASMEPTLRDGEFVLVDPSGRPTVGAVVVARPVAMRVDVVKRVGSTADSAFELVSDNVEAGTDSRTWGLVDRAAIDGVVTLILDRPFASLAAADLSGPPSRVASWARWFRR